MEYVTDDILLMSYSPRNRRSHHVVPAGHCWVEGDNGRSSNDSNNFGVVCDVMITGPIVSYPPHCTGVTRADTSTCALCDVAAA